MPRLLSVNVGMPKDVRWGDKTVHTGIWKSPVSGLIMVRRLNIDGDGQGDRAGHGGEQRAVMVYQQESYDFWTNYLSRSDLTAGSFGENFTVTGLADDEVCIGDRYRIGTAVLEVTQPRVTCFRVGLRLDEPRMPNLLVAQHRPGFYLRVITEGEVQAGDDITLVRQGRHQLSVAEVDALLYLPNRDIGQLRKAVDVPALSPGWQQSFHELLTAHDDGAPSVGPPIGSEPGWDGFRALEIAAVEPESPSVLSITLIAKDGASLPTPLPGQYLTLRIAGAGQPAPLRSYSLSGNPDDGRYRISVKKETPGWVSGWLHAHAEVGGTVEAAAPRGSFHLTDSPNPVVLISAGVGITPVLAMLHSLSHHQSGRDIWWLHTARNSQTDAFEAEARALVASLPRVHCHILHTEARTRLDASAIAALGLPADADAYVCGPSQFMSDMGAALAAAGLDPAHIHSELFGALPSIRPGVVDNATVRTPHAPPGPTGNGPTVTFARSNLAASWNEDYASILDFAEACDVPTRFSCRSGVCHMCETGVISGAVQYTQPPLELPPQGSTLICSATPAEDVVLDL